MNEEVDQEVYPDIYHELSLTLEDLYHYDKEHIISYTRFVPCTTCSSSESPLCTLCSGEGLTY